MKFTALNVWEVSLNIGQVTHSVFATAPDPSGACEIAFAVGDEVYAPDKPLDMTNVAFVKRGKPVYRRDKSG